MEIPDYKGSFQINYENDILMCEWEKLDPSIQIEDVVVEETLDKFGYSNKLSAVSEYLIAITKDKHAIMLAMNRICDMPKKIDSNADINILYNDSIVKKKEPINAFCYRKIASKNQMEAILTILSQKIANPHGHFHYANEQFIYHKIFHSLLHWKLKKQLNIYLKNRSLVTKDNFDSEPKVKICKNQKPFSSKESDINIIEYYEGNYIDEDATIMDAIIETQYRYDFLKDFRLWVQYRTKEHQIETILLCQNFNSLGEAPIIPYSIESIYRYFSNNYVDYFNKHYYNLYTFYILPCNENQFSQIYDIILKKDGYFDLDILDILNLLEFSCKGGFSTLEPDPIKKEDLPKKLEEIKSIAFHQKQIEKNNQIKQIEEQLIFHLQQIEKSIHSLEELQNTNLSVPKIKIPMYILLIEVEDHLEINPIFSSYLKYIDLGGILFNNVKVSGLDFSNTNAHIEPQVVYQRDMSYGNYQGIDFTFTSFENVNITGSLFDIGYNGFLYNNIFLNAIDEKKTKTKQKE